MFNGDWREQMAASIAVRKVEPKARVSAVMVNLSAGERVRVTFSPPVTHRQAFELVREVYPHAGIHTLELDTRPRSEIE